MHVNFNLSNTAVCENWHRPLGSVLKCNVDAAFFAHEECTGFGMVVRNGDGECLAARTHVVPGILSVGDGEVIGILEALSWVYAMGFKDVLFEFDAKGVVVAVKSGAQDVSEFGSLIC
ncbi:hypothetical protein PTKIN_Ptkin17bG0071900 [Pterospermum kingtungense]